MDVRQPTWRLPFRRVDAAGAAAASGAGASSGVVVSTSDIFYFPLYRYLRIGRLGPFLVRAFVLVR